MSIWLTMIVIAKDVSRKISRGWGNIKTKKLHKPPYICSNFILSMAGGVH